MIWRPRSLAGLVVRVGLCVAIPGAPARAAEIVAFSARATLNRGWPLHRPSAPAAEPAELAPLPDSGFLTVNDLVNHFAHLNAALTGHGPAEVVRSTVARLLRRAIGPAAASLRPGPADRERLRREGQFLLRAFADEPEVVADLARWFTRLQLWSDDSAWALRLVAERLPWTESFEEIEGALPFLSRGAREEIARAITAWPCDHRIVWYLLGAADSLDDATTEEILKTASLHLAAEREGRTPAAEWFAWENEQFGKLVHRLRSTLPRSNLFAHPLVREAFAAPAFEWLDRATWIRPRVARAPHLALVSAPDCRDALVE